MATWDLKANFITDNHWRKRIVLTKLWFIYTLTHFSSYRTLFVNSANFLFSFQINTTNFFLVLFYWLCSPTQWLWQSFPWLVPDFNKNSCDISSVNMLFCFQGKVGRYKVSISDNDLRMSHPKVVWKKINKIFEMSQN